MQELRGKILKVAKFGGSSVATGECFEMVKGILDADPSRAVVIVSAPGKRFGSDIKVTDLLYLLRAHIKYNAPYDELIEKIRARYQEICDYCKIDNVIAEDFEKFAKGLSKKTSVDYIASRGEYFCARLMAEYLGYAFVDGSDWLVFDYNGKANLEKSYDKLSKIAETNHRMVIPGFYGAMPDGNIKTFSRGGSDITGAIAAAALNATAYENWTDVSGILAADPRIVDNPRPIDRVTFSELRELSYMGADVLHEETVFPVRSKSIPLYIKNTKDIEAPGTLIMESFDEDRVELAKNCPITGISGKKNYTVITVAKSRMNEEPGCIAKALQIFADLNINIEHIPSSIDTFSIVVAGDEVNDKIHSIISQINDKIAPDTVTITNEISLIAVVGRNLTKNIGIAGRIFTALGANGINIRLIEQGADEVNIIVGVEDKDFNKAIRVLHEF